MEQDNLADSLRNSERSRQFMQAGVALIVFSFILGGGTLALMHFGPRMQQQVPVQAVATTTPVAPDAFARVALIGKSAVVYDLTTGQTLYAQNMYAQLPLASVTKLLTLYAASQVLSSSTPVVMTPDSVAHIDDVADIGFHEGETFAFEDLARLTLAASSNSGAKAITEAAASARGQNTTSLLASAAAALDLKQTYALNSTGLDQDQEVSGAYGSAHDVALLAGSLLKKEPLIAQASTQPVISARSTNGTNHTFSNTNVDVTHIPNILLSKTGYTDLAGGNLVVVYDAGIGHPVAVVVLGSTESGRFTDVQQLISATSAHFAGTTPPVQRSATSSL